MVWYGMVWYGMVWYGMVWYSFVWWVLARGYGVIYGLYRLLRDPFKGLL